MQANISTLLRSAWSENSSLAIQLSARFQSAKLYEDIRGLLLNIPEKALDEPGALEILLGSALPVDVSFQLKVNYTRTKRKPSANSSSICFIGPL